MVKRSDRQFRVTVREHFLGDKEAVGRGIRLWANLLLRHVGVDEESKGKGRISKRAGG